MSILVGTDFSQNAALVADVAAEVARRRGEDLVLAHVVDGPLLPSDTGDATRISEEARRLAAHGCRVRTTLAHDGPFGARLAALADEEKAELLVVGAQGAGLRSPLGTVATMALRHTTAPVLVVRRPERLWEAAGRRLRVLVPFAVDGTDAGLVEALQLVAATGDFDADFAHYRVVPEPRVRVGAPMNEAALRERFPTLPAGLTVRSLLERDAYGRLDSHVSDLARERDVDLVVCGSHHRHGVDRLREGSTSEGIALHAPVSVLVARAPG